MELCGPIFAPAHLDALFQISERLPSQLDVLGFIGFAPRHLGSLGGDPVKEAMGFCRRSYSISKSKKHM
jgi:hypothetical protein